MSEEATAGCGLRAFSRFAAGSGAQSSSASVPARARWRWAIGLAGWALLACTAAGTRPHFGPLPGALVDTLGAGPGQVIQALGEMLQAHGIQLAAQSPAEGYLETRWFDPVTGRPTGTEHRHTGLVFRLRAYADSVPPAKCELVLEAVYRRVADPSLAGRENEIVAPPGHPADSVAQGMLERLRRRFAG